MKFLRIVHEPSETLIAEGPVGWGITPFEGNLYVRKRYLRTQGFKVNFIPGVCVYKFLYVWLDLHLADGDRVSSLGWMYFLANPLFPFIWFRVGMPRSHPELRVEEFDAED